TVGGEGHDAQSGYGTVFKITPAGTFTTIHSFTGSDGSFAKGELTRGSDGNFYGTTSQGGAFFNAATFQSGYGSIFQITPAGAVTTLHSFAGSGANDGSLPYGGPIQASDGSFYGTTEGGGPSYAGIAYRISGPTPQLVSAVSRKTHGSAGTFDVDLALDGSGIECRSGGPNGDYQLVMTFAFPVTFTSATVSSGTGGVAVVLASGNQVFVNLTGVANAQKITVTLVAVNDGTNRGDVPVSMGVLLGDANASGRVDSTDVFQVRQQTLQNANSSNFRMDVDESGRIDSTDVFIVRQQTLTALP
ncbi:MAG TPA: choice-of-anchor tandem repeat GloVer-containing protein, partial [Chthoniobacterales bacterium]|nr:choice-of-anchor tandem repeat GloVer-containing protein [Chthoniobacterales bacterium]